MPQFGLSESPLLKEGYGFGAARSSSTSFVSPSSSHTLACISPDGRSVHLLHGNRIETHALPLAGTSEDVAVTRVPVISTPLPLLGGDGDNDIVELLCVEGDSMPPPEFRNDEETKITILPLLCVYTRHTLLILKIGYVINGPGGRHERVDDTEPIQGEILQIIKPFEGEIYPSSTILRVRPAPQRRLGYAPFQSPGSLAALVATDNGHACLLVYHAKANTVTQQLTFAASEDLVGGETLPTFVDFAFCQSNAQSLLVSLAIHLVKSNGELWAASPILFDGCMVPAPLFQEAYALLEDYYDTDDDDHNDYHERSELLAEAKQKQCRAAMYFLREAFEPVQGPGDYMVGRLHGGSPTRSTLWPIQLQGPLVEQLQNQRQYGGRADASSSVAVTTIEPFFARNLVGFAMAGPGGVQLAVTPPTMLLPRFTYESVDDASTLNAQLHLHMVEQITDLPCTALVRDSVLDTMIHCISDRGVTTLTSHALRHFSSSLLLDAKNNNNKTTGMFMSSPPPQPTPPPTKAWMAVDLTNDVYVKGAVVSGDAHLGHVLVVYLSTGQVTAINLTETRVRYETLQKFSQTTTQPAQPAAMVRDDALQTMEATPAFHEQLGPVVERIESGLLGMTKLVGSATHPKDVDAGLLATALSIRQKCEQDVIVHLKYLRQMTALRHSELRKVIKGQLTQLQAIQDSLKLAKSKRNAIREKMAQFETKSRQLAERSSTILQASKDLRPALTQADVQYFAMLKRLKAQCHEWETKVDQLSYVAQSLEQMASSCGFDRVELEPEEVNNIRAMLLGQNVLITKTQEQIEATQELVTELVQQSSSAK
jgi:hypothetical protein